MAAPTALYSLLNAPSGSQVYVDYLNGNDSTGTGAIGSPWKTINKAYTTLGTTGIINVRYSGGVVNRPLSGERWTLQKNATAGSPITIRTAPEDSPNYISRTNMAVCQGSFLCGGSGSTQFSGLRIEDLEIYSTSGLARGAAGVEGIKVENFKDIEITRCHIHDTIETGILLTGSVSDGIRVDNWHVHKCYIHHVGTSHVASGNNHDHGIYIGGETVGGAHTGQIFNSIIHDCHYGSCIQFFPLGTSNIAAYNSCYDTSETGATHGTALGNPVMLFYGQSGGSGLGLTDNVVSSNILARNRTDVARLAVETGLNTGTGNRLFKNLPSEISDNNLWGSSAMWVNNATRAADNLTEQDPVWVDVSPSVPADFHLQASSPCRNAGEANYLPTDDFFATARNGVKDIGAVAFATQAGGGSGDQVNAHGRTYYYRGY